MRNSTKLKQILLKYDLALSLEEESFLKMTLVDKATGKMESFEHASYSHLIGKAYGFLMKSLKSGQEKSGIKKDPEITGKKKGPALD